MTHPSQESEMRAYQCPGCWSVTRNVVTEDGYECDCGERLTRIDLRDSEVREQAATEVRRELLAKVREALTSEDEVAHGEAFEPSRGGLGVCAYCDGDWPCRTQRGIDRLFRLIEAEEPR